jgi:histidyl-tRNA synthetase
MTLSTQPYKGTRDFYPADKAVQDWMFAKVRRVAKSFGFEDYDGPMLEAFELYAAKTGEEIVNQQLFWMEDRGGRKLAVRPEMTPTLARMVAARIHELPQPLRYFSIPNLWRYERPQKGRLREHWQINADILGGAPELADLEVLLFAFEIFRAFGGEKFFELKINSRRYVDEVFRSQAGLSDASALGLMKLVDAKDKMGPDKFDEGLRALALSASALQAVDRYLKADEAELLKAESQASRELVNVMTMLKSLGVPYRWDPGVMRGMDYYTGLVFEGFDTSPENRRALFGGGRYDDLVALFGKAKLPGVGFGLGDVTLFDFLNTHQLLPQPEGRHEFFVVCAVPSVLPETLALSQELRAGGLCVSSALQSEGIGAQLKVASKQKIRWALILGEDELQQQRVTLKNLESGEQKSLARSGLAQELRALL